MEHRMSKDTRNNLSRIVGLSSLVILLIFLSGRPKINRLYNRYTDKVQTTDSKLVTCSNPFHLNIRRTTEKENRLWPCFVRPPVGYVPPLRPNESLWRVPRAVLGHLDENSTMYQLYVRHQRWADIQPDFVFFHKSGGTAGRAFKTNFQYVEKLLEGTNLTSCCISDRKPIMLDMGGGIGSVAAALADPRGGKGSIRTLTYVLPDEILRLQVFLSHRRLPSYVAEFNGSLPFPEASLDILHCKWCWHHLVGYDLWLDEVNRVLAPGGFFIFTFTKDIHEMLTYPEWDNALRRQPFKCEQKNKIMLFCRKHQETSSEPQRFCDTDNTNSISTETEVTCEEAYKKTDKPDEETRHLQRASLRDTKSVRNSLRKTYGFEFSPRLLSLNCPLSYLCTHFESFFGSRYVMHLGDPSNKEVISDLLGRGKLAMYHEWAGFENMPMYPRSFDVVHVGCTSTTEDLVYRSTFWIDVHRVLRPHGTVFMMKSTCLWKERPLRESLSESLFSIEKTSRDVIIAVRKSL